MPAKASKKIRGQTNGYACGFLKILGTQQCNGEISAHICVIKSLNSDYKHNAHLGKNLHNNLPMIKRKRQKQGINRQGRKPGNLSRQQRNRGKQQTLEDQVISFLAGMDKPASITMIMHGIGLPGDVRNSLKTTLTELVRNGKITRKSKKFIIPDQKNLVEAIMSLTSRGFGFASLDGKMNKGKDIFIKQRDLGNASHGDTVLVRVLDSGSRGRSEGIVVMVKKRSVNRLCGIFNAGKQGGYVFPDHAKLPFKVFIDKTKNKNAKDGQAVLAKIDDYGDKDQSPNGEIIEVLGDPLTAPVQIRMAIEQLSLPLSFPPEVLKETDKLSPLTTCDQGRRDLRDIKHVTIDGATARDFDDAICVEQTKGGFRLFISIADVSHYVQPGSAIDKEAYKRGTSVYFTDMVLPMLPERLSNDLCSLVPDQDRPAFTAILDFDRQGSQIKAEYCRSMIRSRQRFTYDTVHEILYLKDKDLQNRYKDILPMLTMAEQLAKLLRKRREKRGSLGFTIPEAFITIKNGKVSSISHTKRNEAHLLIEDFMLAANEAVAETLALANRDVLFRIHEKPDPEKVKTFTEAASAMGLILAKTEINPAWFATVLDEVRDKPEQYVINNLLLRTMQQARYSLDNAGHFGLAAPYYLHFTSPIRRYPDLIAHRVLNNFLSQQNKKEGKQSGSADNKNLDEAAVHLSQKERRAVEGERDVRARLACIFLIDKIGEEFEAVISGVSGYGLYIELIDMFISGQIPVGDMKDDYYILDNRSHRLVGERTNKIFQMGDTIKVRLERVDLADKRILFSLCEGSVISEQS